MNIGKKFKDERKKLALSQMQVVEEYNDVSSQISIKENAKKAKTITTGTLSNWENGVFSPDPDSIAILCRILKIDPNNLFGIGDLNNQEFVVEFNKLNEEQKKYIMEIIKSINK